MKKKWILLVLFLFIIVIIVLFYLRDNHTDNIEIITEIEDNKSHIIGIHYPKTNIQKLDEMIIEYISQQKNYFLSHYGDSDYLIDRDELNIDYRYYLHDNSYISIALITYINSYKVSNPIYEVNTFFYDIQEDKKLALRNILLEDSQEIMLSTIKNIVQSEYSHAILEDNIDTIISKQLLDKDNFFINGDDLIFYLTPDLLSSDYYDLIEIPISLDTLSFSIALTRNKQIEKIVSVSSSSRVIDPSQKVIALTFDDGPSNYTEEIIGILKENDACATFFILGNKVIPYQNVLQQSIMNGNELGNHSYNHKWLSRLSVSNFIDQVESTQNVIQEVLNYTPTYLRPTYGSVTNRMRKNTDLKIVLWTVDTKDWKLKNVDRIVERATDNVEDGDIILMHDIFERSKEALKKIIPILKEQGFQFVTISELEEVKLIRTKLE